MTTEKKNGPVGRLLLDLMSWQLHPAVAFLIGCAGARKDSPRGRALLDAGLADDDGHEYISLNSLGYALAGLFDGYLATHFPEQPAEPEPVLDEPTQPVPDPPAPPAALQVRSACVGCGRPDVGGHCPDCIERAARSHALIPEDVVESMRRQRG